jgi:hypothetical protein
MHQTLEGLHPATVRRGGQTFATRPRLRVGALIDARDMQRWQLLVLRQLLESDFCELTILTVDGRRSTDRARSPTSPFVRLRPVCRHLLYRLYERADRRKFGLPDDPLSPASLDELRIESVRRPPAAARFEVALSDEALEAIAREGLDVLLCLTADADLRLLAPSARFGAWSFEAAESGGALPLFRETFAANSAIVSAIHVANERYGERVVCRSSTSTEPLSLHRNRNATHAKAPHLLLRSLSDLYRLGWDAISSAPPADVRPSGRRVAPTNAQMLPFLWRVYRRRGRVRFRGYLFEEQWYLAYRRQAGLGRTALPARPDTSGALPWTVIRPPAGRGYADPFVLRYGDRHLVFFEEYDPSIQRGAISYIEIERDGRHAAPRRALEREYHLSYPFVFRERDAVYLIPETRSRRRIELYRATRFPCEWELERVLMDDIPAADATLLRHEGTFWLFVAVAPGGGPPLDELHLFYADSLLGEWRRHPMNPVVADAGSARPAGRIFWLGDGLIRPAQDCARSYGRRVVLNRIEVLDRTRYRESPVGSIEPARSGRALKAHCYNFDGDYEVLDASRLYPRLRVPDFGRTRADRASGRFNIALSDRDARDGYRR